MDDNAHRGGGGRVPEGRGEKQKSEELTDEEGIESGRRSVEEVEVIGQPLIKPIIPVVACSCIA